MEEILHIVRSPCQPQEHGRLVHNIVSNWKGKNTALALVRFSPEVQQGQAYDGLGTIGTADRARRGRDPVAVGESTNQRGLSSAINRQRGHFGELSDSHRHLVASCSGELEQCSVKSQLLIVVHMAMGNCETDAPSGPGDLQLRILNRKRRGGVSPNPSEARRT